MLDRFRKRRSERPGRVDAGGGEAGGAELAAAASELASALGAVPAEEARLAALERLNELRAAGAITEEAFAREKQRLGHYG